MQSPILSETRKKKSLKCVLNYQYKRWGNWITIDEKWFELRNNKVKGWLKKGSKEKEHVIFRQKIPDKLMVVGAICPSAPEGKIGLYEIKGTLNGKKYCEVIQNIVNHAKRIISEKKGSF